MKAVVKLSEIKEKYPDLEIENNKFGVPIFLSINCEGQTIGFNCEFIKISEGGYNKLSLDAIHKILNIPIPDGLDSSDLEAGKLIWRTFYVSYKDEIDQVAKDYIVIYNIFSDNSILKQFNSAIIYG